MPTRPIVVVALAYEGTSAFDLAIPGEIFGSHLKGMPSPWYEYIVCGVGTPPFGTGSGVWLSPSVRLEEVPHPDLVIVPGWRDVGECPPEDLVGQVVACHERGSRVMSVCTGAFVLAAAGLLNGRRATTHWADAALLAERFPLIEVQPDVLYIDDGDILTSAGMAAGIDLCLHVVRQDHGAEAANRVARRMVVPPHRPGGQSQFIEKPVPESKDDDRLGHLLSWMLEHLDDELTLESLAGRVHMSPRTLSRRFVAVTGASPHRWLLEQRILLAQRLLEATGAPVERVAQQTGFGSGANFRQHFSRLVGTSPQSYRRTFRID